LADSPVTYSVNARGVIQNLRALAKGAPKEFENALVAETLIEVKECKRATPVDEGDLQAGIHMEGPTSVGKDITTHITTDPAQDEYAWIVHEDLDANHTTGGPKYIEQPLREARPHFPDRIAARIDLNRAMKG
jgi:hypothetical protein